MFIFLVEHGILLLWDYFMYSCVLCLRTLFKLSISVLMREVSYCCKTFIKLYYLHCLEASSVTLSIIHVSFRKIVTSYLVLL